MILYFISSSSCGKKNALVVANAFCTVVVSRCALSKYRTTTTTRQHKTLLSLQSYSSRNRRRINFLSTISSSSSSYYNTALAYKDIDDDIIEEELDNVIETSNQKQQQNKQNQHLFEITAPYEPTGDQPYAIEQLTKQIVHNNDKYSILQGITGTGKTLVMAHIIANNNKPCLILCHNKTLAAQIARELRTFLSNNAIELFVSYYNYYVPESYNEKTNKYIKKKSSINTDIDILRHSATRSLVTRTDVVIVASVSCIYGIGLPTEYLHNSIQLHIGQEIINNSNNDNDLSEQLSKILYDLADSNDDLDRGQYIVEDYDNDIKTTTLWPPYERFPIQIRIQKQEQNNAYKIIDIRKGEQSGMYTIPNVQIFPAKHHNILSNEQIEHACNSIETELKERVHELNNEKKFIEIERLQSRVYNDINMIRETGYCNGIENYSRHFSDRRSGDIPDTMLNYFNNDNFLLIIDESHVTVSQLNAMYEADQARKHKLIKYGYRLPSALDNRPLKSKEFWKQIQQTLFVSATPSYKNELQWLKNYNNKVPVEMIIRPTYIPDPIIHIRKSDGQLDDIINEIKQRINNNERTIIITLTKRDAEDLSKYINNNNNINSTYIHADLTTNERTNVIKQLQIGDIDVLVGVNLLREGIDIPQVSLIIILNADSEGFLRSDTALLQIIGRAARNVNGTAILYYKNRITDSMKRVIDITTKRRNEQITYNTKYGHTMRTTTGTTTMSIFDLTKDEIDSMKQQQQQQPLLEIVNNGRQQQQQQQSMNSKLMVEFAIQKSLNINNPTMTLSSDEIITDHIPNSPGCYMWKDNTGKILYIGKAIKLRSRVKSYLSSSAKHSNRIQAMINKAVIVDFILTPGERDALILESNLIKYHQPPFNVLLKDDEHYPYICASYTDEYPRFYISSRIMVDDESDENNNNVTMKKSNNNKKRKKNRYFGPYTSYKEINTILEGIEDKYKLREKSFLTRHGSFSLDEYKELFDLALNEIFDDDKTKKGLGQSEEESLVRLRTEYEEAGFLFDSKINHCRDVVVVGYDPTKDSRLVVVQVLQLRDGIVAGRFSYECHIPAGKITQDDFGDIITTVLISRHYPSGTESNTKFKWIPEEILLSHKLPNMKQIRTELRLIGEGGGIDGATKTTKAPKTTTSAKKGERLAVDTRTLEFAMKNVQHELLHRSGGVKDVINGKAATELASLIGCKNIPSRIECYDVSHTQGTYTVASRVVFIDGLPVPALYRKFNIKTVEGIDDYACLEEVIERRFRRVPCSDDANTLNGSNDPWKLPDLVVIDGGPGQLSAAMKGMMKAKIEPLRNSCLDMANKVAICSLAKKEEQIYLPDSATPIDADPDSAALLLLRALRDESHRFALKAHRERRSILKST